MDRWTPSTLLHSCWRSVVPCARASSADEGRRAELCGIIERKLQGSIKSRNTGLELLRVILSKPNQPLLQSEVQLSVRWALHAVSSAKLSSDTGTLETFPHQLVVLAAAVIISAVPYLTISDLIGIRDGWLLPRLQAQALTWLRHGDGQPPVCSVRSHVCIPIGERLPMNAVVALFHADMVLTAYVDPMDFGLAQFKVGSSLGCHIHRWKQVIFTELLREILHKHLSPTRVRNGLLGWVRGDDCPRQPIAEVPEYGVPS